MSRVVVLGSTGQLGTDLVELLRQDNRFEVIPLTHQEADCTDAAAIRKVVMGNRPQIVINSAAYVRVDDCEDHADEAFRVNAVGALNIAKACAEVGALCVYISTDYVFDGTKEAPYVESDSPNPINVYGASKLAGEHLVRQAAPRWLIVRVASLFGKTGARGKGGNFVETILAKAKKGEALRVVNDIRISPTYTRDAAEALRHLLANNVTGIVHAANGGSCTWYEFAKTALDFCDLSTLIEPIASSAFPTRARRPRNSVLASERSFTDLSGVIPGWYQGLQSYLLEKGYCAAARPDLHATH